MRAGYVSMTLTYENVKRPIRSGYPGTVQRDPRLTTHDWQMLDGGLGSKRPVPNGDFAEIDRGFGRLKDVLRDVRLQWRRPSTGQEQPEDTMRWALTMYVPA